MRTTTTLCLFIALFLPNLIHSQITFTEIDSFAFLDTTAYLRGVSWIDVDNDHDLDVSVSGNSGTFPAFVNQTAIYLNTGNNNFVNNNGIMSTQANPHGHSWADYDNDGDLDVYLAATWNSMGLNEFWLNDGTGQMTMDDATGATPNQSSPYEGNVAWGDYNNDGFVDLFIPRWNDMSNKFYQNEGDGTFSEIIVGEIANDEAWTSAAVWGDYDNDNDLDLYVVNYQIGSDPAANDLFENNGNGFLIKVSGAGAVITDEQNSRAANWVDVNNDGFLDLFVVNQNDVDKLYTNNGDGTFSTADIGGTEITWSSNWGDYDNDGDPDLFVMSFLGGDSKLWENDGTGMLTDVTDSFPNITTQTNGSNANGVIFVDYDNDGWLDLHITQPMNSPDKFYRNNGDTCVAWLEIDLRGTESNAVGIGSKVRVKANVGGSPLWQMQQVSSQTSRIGQNPIRLHFGFQKAAVIDSLVVEWPSGNICVLQNVAVNRVIEIEESTCLETTLIDAPPLPGTTSLVSICNAGQDTLFTPLSGPGGIWSADCGDCIGQDGTFFSSSTPAGNYEVLYNIGGICGMIDTFLVELVTTTGISETLSFCEGAPDMTLQGPSGDGGVWSADCGACLDSDGVLAISTLEPGDYVINHVLTTACAVLTDTITVTIEGNNAGEDTTVDWCPGSEAADFLNLLNGDPDEGGTWLNSAFDEILMPYEPTANETIFYTVQNGNCTDTAEVDIIIQSLPEISASPDTTIFTGTSVTLFATGGTTYNWFPSAGLSCTDCANPVFTAGDSTTFLVTGFNEFGCEDTASVTVTVILQPFAMPNTFTPNNDGLNDTFKPIFFEGVFASYHLTIYNRWGELVFETMDPDDGWNGEFQNENAVADTYIYVVDYQLGNGDTDVLRGDLTLIR